MEGYIARVEALLLSRDGIEYDPEFIDLQYEVYNELVRENVGIEAVTPILELFERHPLTEFGTPGPLVHFCEKQSGNGYEELLVASVRKTPTIHTVWMLNCLINDAAEEKAAEYMRIMESICDDENTHEIIRGSARDFLEFQGRKAAQLHTKVAQQETKATQQGAEPPAKKKTSSGIFARLFGK